MMDPGQFLVIGYGNTLRRDDGVGPRVAQALSAFNLAGVRAIALHQLAPELAEPISQASGVIFVDARVSGPPGLTLEKLEPGNGIPALDHALDPPALLKLAGELFGRTPSAWILAIPVTDMEFGDTLSPAVQAAIDLALNQIQTHFSRFQEMPS